MCAQRCAGQQIAFISLGARQNYTPVQPFLIFKKGYYRWAGAMLNSITGKLEEVKPAIYDSIHSSNTSNNNNNVFIKEEVKGYAGHCQF